ncbi:MAG: DUF1684 domain-containing protein [Bacteroidetes bacterium]|nr:DUF1684 domain-containing protein [Bacteroidota bacterium]
MKVLARTVLPVLAGCLLLQNRAVAQTSPEYRDEIVHWNQQRIDFLRSPAGWLNLEGLFWLHPGRNYFGSAGSNDLVYKHPSMPAVAGYFEWENGEVKWVSQPGVSITLQDSVVNSLTVFEEAKPAPLLALQTLRWNVIKREDKMGIRLRDIASKAVRNFRSIERYPTNIFWRVTAKLEAPKQGNIFITNVLGQTNAQQTPGKLVFSINGKTYRLDALLEEDQLFIIFADATNGKDTYPSGRFLYAALPDEKGNTVLDFNKAYNPPCAFSAFATCPLPPPQNRLPFAIPAGEKNYHAATSK